MVHRGKDYQDLQHGVVEKIRKVLDTDIEIYLAPASASGFLEGCVRSAVDTKMAGLSNGSFGDRWQIGKENGKQVEDQRGLGQGAARLARRRQAARRTRRSHWSPTNRPPACSTRSEIEKRSGPRATP